MVFMDPSDQRKMFIEINLYQKKWFVCCSHNQHSNNIKKFFFCKIFTEFSMLILFTDLSFMEFQVRYLALFLLFVVYNGFEWFCFASFHKNIQLILEFIKALFLVQHFSYYTFMTFLTILSVILISMLMILLFFLSVIKHLICGNNLNRLLNLNLIYQTLWTGARSGSLMSML